MTRRPEDILQDFVRLIRDAKRSRTNPNVLFCDARDAEAFCAEANEFLSRVKAMRQPEDNPLVAPNRDLRVEPG